MTVRELAVILFAALAVWAVIIGIIILLAQHWSLP